MQIEVKYCNNIDHAQISIVENKLNIKFASNGTGKSTLSKAIIYKVENKEDSLKELMPFKLKSDNPENITPQVTGIDNIGSVMCFSEEYINQIVFKPDELIDNSFDIFIRNEDYQEIETAIDNMITKIKNLFLDNQELETLISNLDELGKAFKLTKTGISKTSNGIKCLASGNKIKHIPDNLKPFSDFIGSEKNINWIDWQIKGYDFLELSDSCPFCQHSGQFFGVGLEKSYPPHRVQVQVKHGAPMDSLNSIVAGLLTTAGHLANRSVSSC